MRYVGIWLGTSRLVHRVTARPLSFHTYVMFADAGTWRTRRFITPAN